MTYSYYEGGFAFSYLNVSHWIFLQHAPTFDIIPWETLPSDHGNNIIVTIDSLHANAMDEYNKRGRGSPDPSLARFTGRGIL